MLLILLLRDDQLLDIRMVGQVRRTIPSIGDGIGRRRDTDNAVIGKPLENLLLQPIDEAGQKRVAAHDEDVGEQAWPETDGQSVETLLDDVAETWLAHAHIVGVEDDLWHREAFVA